MGRTRTREKRSNEDRGRVEFLSASAEFSVDRKNVKDDSDGRTYNFIEGHSSIFNNEDAYRDIVMPGAFKDTLKEKGPKVVDGKPRSGIKGLWQHNADWPFSLPLEMDETDKGLWQLDRVLIIDEKGYENRTNIERLQWIEELVDGQSIGFITMKQEIEEDDEDEIWPVRRLLKIDLWEHSYVTFPANSEAMTELVTRSRELALAVNQLDQGGILEMASRMGNVSIPAVEQAIAILTTVKSGLDAKEDVPEGEPQPPDPDDPIANGDTEEGDPEIVKLLEEVGERSAYAAEMARLKRKNMHKEVA